MLYLMMYVVCEGERCISVEIQEARVFRSCHLSLVRSANRDYLIHKLNQHWHEHSPRD
jgi:hypothetical protein